MQRSAPAQAPKATAEPISFMRVKGDVWGILSDVPLNEGQSVDIRKRNGEVARVVVGSLLRRAGYRYLYAQDDDGLDLPPREPPPPPPPTLAEASLNDCSAKADRSQDDPSLGRRYPERVCLAIVALARGMSLASAARASGLSRRRVRYIRERGALMTPEQLLAAVQSELLDSALDAARTLRRVATDPTVDVFAQLRAADSVLDRTVGKPGGAATKAVPSDAATPSGPGADLDALRSALAAVPPAPADDIGEE